MSTSASTSVKQFAETISVPLDTLLKQLAEAGVGGKQADDPITEDEKTELLLYLRRAHGAEGAAAMPRRVTLTRKVVTELKQADSGRRGAPATGRTSRVTVITKRSRTYAKREEPAPGDEAAEGAQTGAPPAAVSGAPDTVAPELASVPADTAILEQAPPESAAAPAPQTEPEPEAAPDARGAARAAATPAPAPSRAKGLVAPAPATPPPARAGVPGRPAPSGPLRSGKPDRKAGAAAPEAPGKTGGPKRRKNERDVRGQDAEGALARIRRRPRGHDDRRAVAQHGFERPVGFVARAIEVPASVTVAELAARMSVRAAEVIRTLMTMGQMVTINEVLDQDTAMLVVAEFGHEARTAVEHNPEADLDAAPGVGVRVPRAPVVTVMGHVDHGKTTLLDTIRKTRVAEGEAGRITQHVGAYHVQTPRGAVTFLDTPGHEAFSAMRARGAALTDIVVLVVAADDGAKPQTVEAIQHARAAGVPLVVAVNKIDKPGVDPDKVKQELTQHGVVPDDWGGDTQFVPLSALTGQGVDALLEAILLQAEVMELSAVADGPARGVVVESELDRGRGPVATVLIQSGTLRKGDMVLAGTQFGRARMLFDEAGAALESVGPSRPARLLGLSAVPNVGDPVHVLDDERRVRDIAQYRQQRLREASLGKRQATPGQDVFEQLRAAQVKQLNVIVKADVQGSLEAIVAAMERLSTDEVAVRVVGSGVGAITETDINLAQPVAALVVGFNVRPDATARKLMKENGVQARYHSIIYELLDEVRSALSGMLEPEIREEIVGLAEVRQVFTSQKFGLVAGCLVQEGVVKRRNPIRVLRQSIVVFQGELESLRRIKEDVQEVRAGTECGIGVKGYEVQVGDQIECFTRVSVERRL